MTTARDDCPNVAEHTPAPSAYLAWHDWAERMARTHRQRQCPSCDLYAIWEPRATTPATPTEPRS